jgi:hypothetical protein
MNKTLLKHLAVATWFAIAAYSASWAQSPLGPAADVSRWQGENIGIPGMRGHHEVNGTFVDVFGSGADIWGIADVCEFVGIPYQGDVEFSVEVFSVDNTAPWAKAGLMLRDSLDDVSPHVMLAETPGMGVTLLRRNQRGSPCEDDGHQAMRVIGSQGRETFQQRGSGGSGASAGSFSAVNLPHWLKLVKRGSLITAYESADGLQWSWVGTVEHECNGQFFLGLAVTSHDDTQICHARFLGPWVSPGSTLPAPAPVIGTGDGLMGSYFATMDETGPASTRCDPVVLFDWSQKQPIAGIGPYRYSVRWDGELEAKYSEPYALQVASDDRAKVWLNGQLLIDEWYEHAQAKSTAIVNLEAGKRYPLRVDYFQNRGRASLQLLWSSPSTPFQPIPQSQLYSTFNTVTAQDLEETYETQLLPAVTKAVTTGCPPGWATADVGWVSTAGSVAVSNGVWTINGSGADVWANSDGLRFVFRPWSGDGQFTARVISQTRTDPWAKAGFMIREGLRSDARHAMLALTPGNGVSFIHRSAPGLETFADDGGAGASGVWVRLVRSGNQVRAFRSDDGTTWTWVGTEKLDFPSEVLVGLAVSSHDNSTLGTALFDEVELQQKVGGPATAPLIGSGTGLNASYFDGATGNVITRVDPHVDFDWDFGSPSHGIGPENFSARWTGWVQAQYSEPYSLHVISDDGARLWLDDQLLVDAWYDHASVQTSARVDLQAGARHTLRLEYYQRSREALVRLLWSSPSTPKQPIPQNQLYTDIMGLVISTGTPSTPAGSVSESRTAATTTTGVTTNSGAIRLTNGALNNGAATSLVTIVDIPASEAVAKLGRWEPEAGGLYAVDRRGWVEYALVVPTAGIYTVEVEAASHNQYDTDPGFSLSLSLDGEALGNALLDAPPKLTGKVHQRTPFVKAGLHLLRVFWDNPRKDRSLKLLAVRLQAPVANASSIAEAATEEVQSRSGIVNFEMSSNTLSSVTSPMCVEGRGRFLSMMKIQAGHGVIAPQPGIEGGWYADVPISPGEPIPLKVSYENAGFCEHRLLRWQPTDLLGTTNLTVRRGDSLLMTLGPDCQLGSIRIEGVTNYTVARGSNIRHRFEKTGIFSIQAVSPERQNGLASHYLKVEVVGCDIGGPIAAWVGKPRPWCCPAQADKVALEPDPSISLRGVDAAHNILSITVPEQRQILVRVAPGGPILSRVAVDGFQVFSSNETNFEVRKTYPDGTQLIEMGIVADPVLPSVRLQIALVVGGVVFDDGTVVKNLTATSFDPLGQYTVLFLRPGDANTSACHTLKAYQAGLFLGQH